MHMWTEKFREVNLVKRKNEMQFQQLFSKPKQIFQSTKGISFIIISIVDTQDLPKWKEKKQKNY